jgi:hypothetical protein
VVKSTPYSIFYVYDVIELAEPAPKDDGPGLLAGVRSAAIPFSTRLFADYIGKDSPGRVAATAYGLSLLLASTLLLALWRYGLWRRLVRPDTADEEVQFLPGQRLHPVPPTTATATAVTASLRLA